MKLKYFEVKDRYHYYLHVPILTKPYCPFAESEYNKKKEDLDKLCQTITS